MSEINIRFPYPIQSVFKVIALCLALTATFGRVASSQSVIPLPPRSNFAPDLQVIVVGGMPGGDVVNVTYPGVAQPAQLQHDLVSLAGQLAVNPSSARITVGGLPETGGQTPPMTSVTFQAQGAAPLRSGTLPLDKIILGLRSYRRLAVTYIMPPRYIYTGFHRYSDHNVVISLLQNGSNCSYTVNILNPDMTVLALPLTDLVVPSENALQASTTRRDLFLFRAGGLVLVSACAILIGWGVYCALAKMH